MRPLQAFKNELRAYANLIRRRVYASRATEAQIVENFHKLYYDSSLFGGTFVTTSWFGVPALKCPLDLWIYQEMIHELKPDLIIETGTAGGGSALFLASMFDLAGKGQVLTIDIEANPKRPSHPRIQYLQASSTSPEALDVARKAAAGKAVVIVILDSNHTQPHVINELRAYQDLVTVGSYLVVEDTNVNGHPVDPGHGPGPMEALHQFLKETDRFEIDRRREKFYLTFNPSGYLKKIR